MKKNLLCCILLLLFISCKKTYINNGNNSESIVSTNGKIKVVVNPNVEMMMILGRISGAEPYNFINKWDNSYINEVDKYFISYKDSNIVYSIRSNRLNYSLIPEYGMYMNQENTGFILNLDNKNFLIQGLNNVAAKKIPYYSDKNFIDEIRKFREESKFDVFFEQHKKDYEEICNEYLEILDGYKFDKWLEDFYGIKLKEPLYINMTYLTGGGNFGISIKNSKGKESFHPVLAIGSNKDSFIYLLAHEASHPLTINISRKLYENDRIRNLFDTLFYKYSSQYIKDGYNSGFAVLNETINQACADKFVEKVLSESVMSHFNKEEIEYRKRIYVLKIADFLNVYEQNRKHYKKLEDFIPELEKYIVTLE